MTKTAIAPMKPHETDHALSCFVIKALVEVKCTSLVWSYLSNSNLSVGCALASSGIQA